MSGSLHGVARLGAVQAGAWTQDHLCPSSQGPGRSHALLQLPAPAGQRRLYKPNPESLLL